ncbi:MAG: hypothetical protein DRJ51_01040 [Thermoprotei archaeon]|nr:MAG: hypothetical protein DRJ51_01040 [Thermoprotei archaeon]
MIIFKTTEVLKVVKSLAKKVVIGLIIFLLTLSLTTFILAYNISENILNADFIIRVGVRREVIQASRKLILSKLLRDVDTTSPLGRLLVNITIESLTDDVVEGFLRDCVTPLIAYMKGEAKTLNLIVNLTKFKENLKKNIRRRIVEEPPDFLLNFTRLERERLASMLLKEVEEYPSYLDLRHGMDIEQMSSARKAISMICMTWKIAAVASLVLVILLVLFRNLNIILVSVGIALIGSGLIVSVILNYMKTMVSKVEPPEGLSTEGIACILTDLTKPLQETAYIALAAGALLIIMYVMRRRYFRRSISIPSKS